MSIAEMGSGGAESVVADLTRGLLDRGHGVTVACSGGWRISELSDHGAVHLTLPMTSSSPFAMLGAIATMKTRAPPVGLIHTHNVRATLIAHAGARSLRRRPPLLTTVHGLGADAYPQAVRILRRCSDLVVAVSQSEADSLIGAGMPSDRVCIIENGVSMPEHHDRVEARTRLNLPLEATVVLCVARMAPPKRQDLLIEAWKSMPANAMLLLVGDGERLAALEASVDKSDLNASVRILGDRQDVDWILAAADVAVLPSDSEGRPMSVLEAMAAGVPVVASAVGGIPELGANSLELVDPQSSTALAAGIRRLISDASRRETLTTNALVLVRDHFSLAAMHRRYRTAYASVLGISAFT